MVHHRIRFHIYLDIARDNRSHLVAQTPLTTRLMTNPSHSPSDQAFAPQPFTERDAAREIKRQTALRNGFDQDADVDAEPTVQTYLGDELVPSMPVDNLRAIQQLEQEAGL
jgi:hypothetical protein